MRVFAEERGFSLIELMMTFAIFIAVSGALFGLVNQAQLRYRGQQQQLDALQPARVGIDQMTRDIHSAGFPALNSYQGAVSPTLIAVPFVGMNTRTSINQNCTVNGGVTPCLIPGPYDLALETLNGAVVNWIYYQVRLPATGSTTCTLYRAVSVKSTLSVPTSATETPLIDQIINTAIGNCDLSAGQYVFTYSCTGASPCNAQNISQVFINVSVITLQRDAQTRQFGIVTLQGVAERINPPQ
ncbi:MAG: hypothetical protein ABSB82_24665 [Terriglobia bacterium]